MRHILRHKFLILALFFALMPSANSTVVDTKRDACLAYYNNNVPLCSGGLKVNNEPLNAGTVYTGWFFLDPDSGGLDDVLLYVTHTYSAATDVTLQCWSDLTSGGAGGSGYELPFCSATGTSAVTCGLGGATVVTGATKSFTLTFTNVPGPWVQCGITATGADANDLAKIIVHGVTP